MVNKGERVIASAFDKVCTIFRAKEPFEALHIQQILTDPTVE